MTLWTKARAVLMFDGMIEPDLAGQLASRISAENPYLLDMSRFGGAQCLVGNTLISHRPLARRLTPSEWTLRLCLRRIFRRRKDFSACQCGWVSRDFLHEYHQADMVNHAVAQYVSDAGERMRRR